MASAQQRPLSEPPPYMEYQGILFPSSVPRESLKAMKTFEIRDDDVVIISYPKSGLNWVFETVHKILGGKKENSAPKGSELWPLGQQEPNYIQLRESTSPRLMFTHLQIQMAPPGLRAPVTKDVCVSSYYYLPKHPLLKPPESWEKHSEDFLSGKVTFGDYFDHVLGWWQKKDDPHFLFVKYEDMKKDFRLWVKTIAAFLEKELTDADMDRVLTSCSLESMRKRLAESLYWRKDIVRKGIVGDWKNHFSAKESDKFDQKYRKRMEGSGLEFEF
ncbi:sulfotransferase [Branchiostoma belcheri]|nr:sulfotransferase [Branchiostoma belcheri]